jgi:hypothetical protein
MEGDATGGYPGAARSWRVSLTGYPSAFSQADPMPAGSPPGGPLSAQLADAPASKPRSRSCLVVFAAG